MDPSSRTMDVLRRSVPWLAGVVLLSVYGPVLSIGPVAEDLQWAYKGWVTPYHPSGWLQPFHQHFRPAGRLFFTIGARLFGDCWSLYRLACLIFTAGLAGAAFRFLRSVAGLSRVPAALALVLWLASPFADEVLLVTNLITQAFYACGVLLVLVLRSDDRRSRGWTAAAAVLAFAGKEEAVVLLPLIVAQDLVLHRLLLRDVGRRALPWLVGTGAYLLAYRTIAGFEASWFYSSPWMAGPHLATTWTAFWHLHPLVPGRFVEHLAVTWPLAVVGLILTVALLLLARRASDRVVPFALSAALISMAPTLPANLHAPRYTFLPYLFFVTAAMAGAKDLVRLKDSRAIRAVLLATALIVIVNDVAIVRGNSRDWRRFAALTEQLGSEMKPVLRTLRAGTTAVVIRGQDTGPLRRLLSTPAGLFKLYFPRPDDPYGVASLSAMASWMLRQESIAADRITTPHTPATTEFFQHEVGAFVPVRPRPAVLDRPFGHGVVILRPTDPGSFDPRVFP